MPISVSLPWPVAWATPTMLRLTVTPGDGARRVGGAVPAGAAVEDVVALAAVEIIVVIAADQRVVAALAAHEIVAVAAGEDVVAGIAAGEIVERRAGEILDADERVVAAPRRSANCRR